MSKCRYCRRMLLRNCGQILATPETIRAFDSLTIAKLSDPRLHTRRHHILFSGRT